MKAILRNHLMCSAFLAMAFLAAPHQVSAGDKTYGECLKDLQTAKDNLNKAETKAQENKPSAGIKKAEDNLDAKARANGDTPGDPAKNPAKKTSDAAENAAKTAADKAVAKWKDAGANTDKAEAYRKALEERRDARKQLKKVIDDLNDLAKRQKNLSEQDDVKTPLKEARDALQESEQAISLSRTATGLGTGESYASLTSTGKIKVTNSGTGETIGHVADLHIQNTTGERISFTVPPMVLESGGGKYQHYACPKGQLVVLDPHEEKTVPIDGVCLVRGKPPLGKDDKSDLISRDGTPGDHPQDSHLPTKDVNKLLRVTASYCDAAEKLEKKGALKEMPYKDPKTRQEIVTQWGVWSNPEIAKCTGSPPATKDDLKTTIYKQAEKHAPVTPETKKKLDEGIDIIFQDIKLTTKEAKNLAKPDPFKGINVTGEEGKGNVSDENKTKEKPQPNPLNPAGALGGTGILDDPDMQARIDAAKKAKTHVLQTQEKLKKAKKDFNEKKEAAVNSDPRVKPLVDEINRLKQLKGHTLATEKDKALFDRKIKEKQDALDRIKGEAEKAWNETKEGKDAGKDISKAEADANQAKEEYKPYQDLDKYTEDAPHERIEEPPPKR